MDNRDNSNNVVIYQSDDGVTKIDVKLEKETVWLSQQQMALLFKTSRINIIEHINNIYLEEELDKSSTCQNFRQVRKEVSEKFEQTISSKVIKQIINKRIKVID